MRRFCDTMRGKLRIISVVTFWLCRKAAKTATNDEASEVVPVAVALPTDGWGTSGVPAETKDTTIFLVFLESRRAPPRVGTETTAEGGTAVSATMGLVPGARAKGVLAVPGNAVPAPKVGEGIPGSERVPMVVAMGPGQVKTALPGEKVSEFTAASLASTSSVNTSKNSGQCGPVYGASFSRPAFSTGSSGSRKTTCPSACSAK